MAIGSTTVAASAINSELGRSSSATISIDNAENGGYATINTCSPSYPSSSNPASFSEWRNYNHSYACCSAPSITSTSVTSNSITVNFTTSNCTAAHIEYSSNYGSTWTTSTGGCTSPRTITGLASGTTYLIRMRITCSSTGSYSSYSSTTSATTTASCPAYGTYLSQYCSGCNLYYRYANGSCGTYDVLQGCSTTCGGCCCAPAYGTYLYAGCSGCDYYYYYADGCYGTYSTLIESNSTSCGCGGGTVLCYEAYAYDGDWRAYDCNRREISGYSWGYEYIGCIDVNQMYSFNIETTGPCGGDPGCLLGDTVVEMADGTTKLLMDLAVNDTVKSVSIEGLSEDEFAYINWSSENLVYNFNTAKVRAIMPIKKDKVYSINNGLLTASIDHVHLRKQNETWNFCKTQDLLAGDIFLNQNNEEVLITLIEEINQATTVWRLDVENTDLFIANGIITHNKKLEEIM